VSFPINYIYFTSNAVYIYSNSHRINFTHAESALFPRKARLISLYSSLCYSYILRVCFLGGRMLICKYYWSDGL